MTNTLSKLCPETCIVFVSCGRRDIAKKSYESFSRALASIRDRVKIVLSDATDDDEKLSWACQTDADDVILTPRQTSAATSRNLATTLILDKYSPRYLCMLEDDFEYHPDWYPSLVDAARRLYGVISPFGLAYGIFSASQHHISSKFCKKDRQNGVTAYMFGSVAYQRFMPTSHYLSVMRGWDPDLLGISFAQTGGQTFRNTMRGFCGAILSGRLSWPIDTDSSASTWSRGKRNPGPQAHSFDLHDYEPIQKIVQNTGAYTKLDKE
jgi:hypothetical protein